MMPYLHKRKSIRLPKYDYTQPGGYFVTLCSRNRKCVFGDILNGKMKLNKLGGIVDEEWRRSPEIRDEIELDCYVIMPNHLHGIIYITKNVRATSRSPQPKKSHVLIGYAPRSLGSFIAGFKSSATKRINHYRHTPGVSVWQRNYFEHVIRNEKSLSRLREYIINNPAKWQFDRENPINQPFHIISS